MIYAAAASLSSSSAVIAATMSKGLKADWIESARAFIGTGVSGDWSANPAFYANPFVLRVAVNGKRFAAGTWKAGKLHEMTEKSLARAIVIMADGYPMEWARIQTGKARKADCELFVQIALWSVPRF